MRARHRGGVQDPYDPFSTARLLSSNLLFTTSRLPPSDVFVHGIHGDRNSLRASTGAYWPDVVQKDPTFLFSDVIVAEYPTPSRNGKYSTSQLAGILWKRLFAGPAHISACLPRLHKLVHRR